MNGLNKIEQEATQEKNKETPSPKTILSNVRIQDVRDALENGIITSFADESNEAWAQYWDGDHKKFSPIKSICFADWVRVNINNLAGQPREAWVDGLIKLLESKARRRGQRQLFTRSADINGEWIFQLSDSECIIIEDGQIKRDECPPIFRTSPYQDQIPVDLTAGIEDINLLDKYTNFTDSWELELFKDTLPAYKIPNIAKPIQLSKGDPGSAKSTLGKLTKKIIDPSKSMASGIEFPKKDGDWHTNCNNHSVLFFDNLGHITKAQQDKCCAVVTGTNLEKRKLFTDMDIITAQIQATIVLNAIDLTGLNSDFIDRALIWFFRRIEDSARMTETVFWSSFKKDLPKINGSIFKILAKAQVMAPKVVTPDLRLKDFGNYAAACSAARGRNPDEFAKNIKCKVETQADESLSQSEIADPLQRFMNDKAKWTGTATELLKLLTEQEYGQIIGSGENEHTVVRNMPKSWPKNAGVFGREISKINFHLERIGLKYQKDKGAKGSRSIILERICKTTATTATQSNLSTTNEVDSDQKMHCHLLPPTATQDAERVAGGSGVADNKNLLPPIDIDEKTGGVAEVAVDIEEIEI